MIISRTPLRIGLVGGGTDLASFYERHGGACVSMAIDKFIYISVNPKFDGRIRMSYSKTENVSCISDLKHDLARECLKMFGVKGVEITSVSDIPGEGTGLGSSSAFVVGLLLALTHYVGKDVNSPKTLAEMAYMVELGCGHPCGKQDFYTAAYGGFHMFWFAMDGRVEVCPMEMSYEEQDEFSKHLLLFWTEKTRKASTILKKQIVNISENGLFEFAATDMRDLAVEYAEALNKERMSETGEFLMKNWELKKKLANGISGVELDYLIQVALDYGATGCKICGAGGGGFLLVFAEPEYHESIQKAVGLRAIPFTIFDKGSRIIYGQV